MDTAQGQMINEFSTTMSNTQATKTSMATFLPQPQSLFLRKLNADCRYLIYGYIFDGIRQVRIPSTSYYYRDSEALSETCKQINAEMKGWLSKKTNWHPQGIALCQTMDPVFSRGVLRDDVIEYEQIIELSRLPRHANQIRSTTSLSFELNHLINSPYFEFGDYFFMERVMNYLNHLPMCKIWSSCSCHRMSLYRSLDRRCIAYCTTYGANGIGRWRALQEIWRALLVQGICGVERG